MLRLGNIRKHPNWGRLCHTYGHIAKLEARPITKQAATGLIAGHGMPCPYNFNAFQNLGRPRVHLQLPENSSGSIVVQV